MEAILAFVPEEDRSGEPGAGGVFLGVDGPELGRSKAEMKLRIAGNPLDGPLVSFLSSRF
jgi:hypothetical protein